MSVENEANAYTDTSITMSRDSGAGGSFGGAGGLAAAFDVESFSLCISGPADATRNFSRDTDFLGQDGYHKSGNFQGGGGLGGKYLELEAQLVYEAGTEARCRLAVPPCRAV